MDRDSDGPAQFESICGHSCSTEVDLMIDLCWKMYFDQQLQGWSIYVGKWKNPRSGNTMTQPPDWASFLFRKGGALFEKCQCCCILYSVLSKCIIAELSTLKSFPLASAILKSLSWWSKKISLFTVSVSGQSILFSLLAFREALGEDPASIFEQNEEQRKSYKQIEDSRQVRVQWRKCSHIRSTSHKWHVWGFIYTDNQTFHTFLDKNPQLE